MADATGSLSLIGADALTVSADAAAQEPIAPAPRKSAGSTTPDDSSVKARPRATMTTDGTDTAIAAILEALATAPALLRGRRRATDALVRMLRIVQIRTGVPALEGRLPEPANAVIEKYDTAQPIVNATPHAIPAVVANLDSTDLMAKPS
ncbi:hypothetical protein [Curtobacterium sp. AG1037]|uniref:hypothetical protein n=1 Tax=Curtobacterium sp. AG1037 TaxID=2183990 RepID=UPI0011C03018|nr:hypothetical protein [Curtobacterium sp. AG1037]